MYKYRAEQQLHYMTCQEIIDVVNRLGCCGLIKDHPDDTHVCIMQTNLSSVYIIL